MRAAEDDALPEDPAEESRILGEAVAVDPDTAMEMEALCSPLEELEEHEE